MVIIRPVRLTDLDALMALAQLTGFGLTTLPRDRDLLRERILESEHGFLRMGLKPKGEVYLFVMEDLRTREVVGTCGIASKTGGFEPFYAYRIEKIKLQSDLLNVNKEMETLVLVQEHNGPCEIGSLFLRQDYRGDGNGRLLSLSRFLFMAEHKERFDPTVIAEMRGVVDDRGQSPFWDALGKHFFEIDFPKADYLSMVNKKFIADLMPRHPIYVPLLPPEAQAVVGQVHTETKPALALLESEGFRKNGMVDIFEAGPVVIAQRDHIRTLRESVRAVVEEIAPTVKGQMMYLLNPRLDSRCARGIVEILDSGHIRLDQSTATALEIKPGETLRIVTPHTKAPQERTYSDQGQNI